MREEEEEETTDSNNVTADTLSIVFSPQRENPNAMFASEKLENSNDLVNAVASFENMTINDVGYELNTETTSEAHVELASNPDVINHTKNGITHKNLLSRCMTWIRHE